MRRRLGWKQDERIGLNAAPELRPAANGLLLEDRQDRSQASQSPRDASSAAQASAHVLDFRMAADENRVMVAAYSVMATPPLLENSAPGERIGAAWEGHASKHGDQIWRCRPRLRFGTRRIYALRRANTRERCSAGMPQSRSEAANIRGAFGINETTLIKDRHVPAENTHNFRPCFDRWEISEARDLG